MTFSNNFTWKSGKSPRHIRSKNQGGRPLRSPLGPKIWEQFPTQRASNTSIANIKNFPQNTFEHQKGSLMEESFHESWIIWFLEFSRRKEALADAKITYSPPPRPTCRARASLVEDLWAPDKKKHLSFHLNLMIILYVLFRLRYERTGRIMKILNATLIVWIRWIQWNTCWKPADSCC